MTTTTKTTKATGRRARYPRERRMLVIADGHSGHDHGLTPPGWWAPPDTSSPRKAGAAAFQRMLWNFYVKQIEALRPIDVLVSDDPIWSSNLAVGFALRCFQRLSRPDAATRRCTWRHNRQTGGLSATVLSY